MNDKVVTYFLIKNQIYIKVWLLVILFSRYFHVAIIGIFVPNLLVYLIVKF